MIVEYASFQKNKINKLILFHFPMHIIVYSSNSTGIVSPKHAAPPIFKTHANFGLSFIKNHFNRKLFVFQPNSKKTLL